MRLIKLHFDNNYIVYDISQFVCMSSSYGIYFKDMLNYSIQCPAQELLKLEEFLLGDACMVELFGCIFPSCN